MSKLCGGYMDRDTCSLRDGCCCVGNLLLGNLCIVYLWFGVLVDGSITMFKLCGGCLDRDICYLFDEYGAVGCVHGPHSHKENNNNQGPTQEQAENQPQRNNNEEINAENTNEEIKEENKENKPNPKGVIVLGVYMHCQGCADKIVKYLRGFDGVEQIETDMKNHIVTVKGKKADPKKILERLPKKSNKHVKLISPILRVERRKQ
ncbi:Heavy metal-associated isoprenylated plant protein 8 [Camellia lanceoleosa]|uniref:Heavy metal-associated isoprenylated plant protein 8 n=1 Tax=Camellia lanceoleosa TaxID=1840588 RepID=A0ACC0G6T2_9ERIC|nr:Heavy metal-associated isoprenylated plant protein 8 [Camellia lanceoleosa]